MGISEVGSTLFYGGGGLNTLLSRKNDKYLVVLFSDNLTNDLRPSLDCLLSSLGIDGDTILNNIDFSCSPAINLLLTLPGMFANFCNERGNTYY